MKIDRQLLRASLRSWVASDQVRAGPYWLQLLWTLLFCAALAAGFTLFAWFGYGRRVGWGLPALTEAYGKNLIVCGLIGFLIHGLFELFGHWMGRERLRRLRGWQASMYFSAIPMLGVAIGWPLGVLLAAGGIPSWWSGPRSFDVISTSILIALALTFGLHLYFSNAARRIEAEKRATEAQLRLLQAQMEPHFLFNTLANVQTLIDHEPKLAKQMLENFTDYLRATLTQLRSGDSTVAAELVLAESYLKLLATRMAERLNFHVENDERAGPAVLPPLLLQPLVENAVHHGLEPKVDGGTVTLRAHVRGSELVLEVQDDGLGREHRVQRPRRGGAGLALTNLRQRLAARYGDAARLELLDATPGTLARLTLPFETVRAD